VTRRELFQLAAQAAYPGVSYRNYPRVVPDFLARLAREAYEKRNRELARLTSADTIGARQRWARETFWNIIGGQPPRTPLNIRSTGSFTRAKYRVERLLYESQPNLHVSANLYIPTFTQPPFPGILFQMGHAPNGKASATYQSCCQGLVQLGFLVLAFDPMGQGERIYYPDASGTRTRLSSPDEEHSVAGRQMLLAGDSASRLQVWDAIRSLDVLEAHPLVDKKRLATTGQSGGGTLSMFLIAGDDRLAAAVVCSGNTENFACANFNAPGSTDDAEQNFPGSGPLGWDRWDLLYPFAPKPLLITVSDRDFFGTYSSNYVSSGWEEFQKLKRIYETLERGERLAWDSTPLPHGLSYDTRLLTYNWLNLWLRGENKATAEEPPVNLEPDETLWASPNGNVVRSFGGETPFELTRKRKIVRAAGSLEQALNVIRPERDLRPILLKRVPARKAGIEAIEVQTEPGVWVPAWVFMPKEPNPSKPSLLLLEPAGRSNRWHEGDMYLALAQQGYVVCVPDLRAVGDLTPEVSRGAEHYARGHDAEDDYAWASLILGRPLLGQRVTDILALSAALARYGRRVVVGAQGKMTVPAAIAAYLDKTIDSIYLSGGLISFRSLLETEAYKHPFANFAPRILEYPDLPEIMRSLAPRKAILAGVVDAAGKPLAPKTVADEHENARHIAIKVPASWEPSSFENL
jgi:dienelactone hydrolase